MKSTLEPNTSETAYHVLRQEILRGNLESGARLTVAQLDRLFGLGMTPTREALMRLAAEGLIAATPNRGVRILDVSREELGDLMQTRREIETILLRRAIEMGDEPWEAEIVSTLYLLSRTPLPKRDDKKAIFLWEDRHRAFHQALVSACGSPWMMKIWKMLVDHSERYRQVRLTRADDPFSDIRDVAKEHEVIANAVIDRDADRACALMAEHLRRTERAVDALLGKGA